MYICIMDYRRSDTVDLLCKVNNVHMLSERKKERQTPETMEK